MHFMRELSIDLYGHGPRTQSVSEERFTVLAGDLDTQTNYPTILYSIGLR